MSRSPAAISPAASVIRPSGRSSRPLVHQPTPRGQQHRDERADDEREQDGPQRALGGTELERLEVVGVDLGDVDADADVVLATEVEPLHARRRRRSTAWRRSVGKLS